MHLRLMSRQREQVSSVSDVAIKSIFKYQALQNRNGTDSYSLSLQSKSASFFHEKKLKSGKAAERQFLDLRLKLFLEL
jgi:hypothetical protein